MEPVSNPEVAYERKKIPFQGSTSYSQQYLPYKIAPQQVEKYEYRPNTAKFAGNTRYNEVLLVLG